MNTPVILSAVLMLAACAAPQAAVTEPAPTPPLASEAAMAAAEAAPLPGDVAHWAAPFAPFTVIGNTHFVGTRGIGAYLITTARGHILIDGGPAQAAPVIAANVAALGFAMRDVRILLNTHAHFDHSGGLARLQRLSGAEVIASAADRAALESGRFPYGPAGAIASPPVRVDRVIGDGEAVTLGGATLTAHLTPGHTPGCTSWSWPARGGDGVERTVFLHCSATVAGQTLVPESYPGMVADFRRTFERVRAIQADVFLANHPEFIGMEALRARQSAGEANAFVDAAALGRFNERLAGAFEIELARQQAR